MNIIILKNNLKEALAILGGIKRENTQLPILKNILIDAQEDGIFISSTDLEIGVVHKIPGKIIQKGIVTVPYTVFTQIISNLAFERVALELKGTSFLITADNYKAKVTTTPPDDFPIIPQVSKKQDSVFTVDPQALLDALMGVSVACQVSDFRPELSGILFHFKEGQFRIVATDSFRLAKQEIINKKIKTNFDREFSFIVPLRTVQEILRIFSGKKQETITIAVEDNQIMFENEQTIIVSRLINGKFPDYEMVIPSTYDIEMTVKKEDIISALKLTSSLSNRLYEVRLILDENMKYMKLVSSSHEFGEGEYMLSVKAKGQPIQISFNWRFILDGIKNIKTENIFIGLNNEQKPSVIRIPDDTLYTYILTSIKTN
ncbi:MAG: DNA polymerase III subunit beta [Candidatus Paceibacterota bacterium]